MEGSTKMMNAVGSMNVALNVALEHYFTRAEDLLAEEMKETPLLKAALKMHLKRQRESLRNKNKKKILTMKGTKAPFLDFREIYVVGKPNSEGAYKIELGPYVGDINIKSFKFLENRMFLKKPTAVAVASCSYHPGDYLPELGFSLGERLFLFGEADGLGFFVAERENGQKGYVREEDLQEISYDINGEQSFTETGNVYEDTPNCYFANEKDMEEKKKSDDWMTMEEERMKLLGLLRTRILELEEENEDMKQKKVMEEEKKRGQVEEEETSEESEDSSDDRDSSTDSEDDNVNGKVEEQEEEQKTAPVEKIMFKRYVVTEKVVDVEEVFNKAMETMKTRTFDEPLFDEEGREEEEEMNKESKEEMTEELETIEDDENSGNEGLETPERSDSGSSFEIIKDEKESLLGTMETTQSAEPRAAVLSDDSRITIILTNMSSKQSEELLDAVKQTADEKLQQWKKEEEEQKEILAEIMAQAVENEQKRLEKMAEEQENLEDVEKTQEESDFETFDEEEDGDEEEDEEELEEDNEDIEDDLEKLSLDVSNCEMKEQLMAEIADEVLLANNKLAEEEKEKKRVFAEKMDELIQMQEAVMTVSDNAERLKLLEAIKESMSQEWFIEY